MMRAVDKLIAAWLGLAVLLQALLLSADAPMSRPQMVQFFVGAICLALIVSYLWKARLYLNPHADMLLIMFTSGGLGMFLGMSSHLSHAMDAMSWWRMCGGMFVLGIGPAIAFSRCLRAARRHGQLLIALLADCSGMLVGMWLATCVRIESREWMAIGRHFTMLSGMTLGMIAGMWIRSTFPRSTGPEARRELTNDTSEACIRAGR
jgi:hypothetical protein